MPMRLLLILLLAMGAWADVPCTTAAGEFTIIFITDSHCDGTAGGPSCAAVASWIQSNRVGCNIVAVLSGGDHNDGNASPSHYDDGAGAGLLPTFLNVIGGQLSNGGALGASGVPYATPPGNHDVLGGNWTQWNTYMSLAEPWITAIYPTSYGGSISANDRGSTKYLQLTIGNVKLGLVSMRMFAPDAALAQIATWMDAEPDRKFILSTHMFHAAPVFSTAMSGPCNPNGSVGTATDTLGSAGGVGSRTFNTQAALGFSVGDSIMAVDADFVHSLNGLVTSYNSGTGVLVVNVNSIVGAGTWTRSSWTIRKTDTDTTTCGSLYLGLNGAGTNYGSLLWASLKNRPNLWAILGGHIHRIAKWTGTATDGHLVETLSNINFAATGAIVRMKFQPDLRRVHVDTYNVVGGTLNTAAPTVCSGACESWAGSANWSFITGVFPSHAPRGR